MVEPASSEPTLRQRFLGSAVWTGLSRVLVTLLSIAVTAVLARLLEPEDFGLLAMVLVFTGLVMRAQDFGFGPALIHRKDVTVEQQQTAFTLALALSCLLYLVMFFLAGPVAAFYDDPRVIPVLRVVALTYPLSVFALIPRAMLRRDLRLRGEALTTTASMIIEAFATIGLAWAGYGVWALVSGRLVGTVATAVGLWIASPWRPRFRIRGGEGRALLRFGGGVTLSAYLWYAYTNADFLIIGRALGSAVLGIYTMAWNLAKMPFDRLWMTLNPLVIPLFSRTRSDVAELGRVLCRVTRYTAFIVFPAVAGLGAVADDAVRVVLGDKWIAAIEPLQWLCVYGLVRGVSALLPPLLIAVGQLKRLLYFHIVCLLVLPASFVVGVRFGALGVAVAWAALYPVVVALVLLPAALAATRLSPMRYASSLVRPMAATLAMVAAVIVIGRFLPFAGWIRLGIRVASGAVVYLGCVRILEGSIVSEIRGLYRDSVKGLGA